MMTKALVVIDGLERYLVRKQKGVIALVLQTVLVNHVLRRGLLHVNVVLIVNDQSGRLFHKGKRPDFVV